VRRASRLLPLLALSLWLAPTLHAASPQLDGVYPRGAQRGTSLMLVLVGRRIADAREVLWYKPGIRVTKLEPKGNRRLQITIQIAANCELGEHPLRLRTASGISELRTFWVGALPLVKERENNNETRRANPVKLNVTVYGRITREDQDYFAFDAKKGQRVTAEVEGMRLATTFFDPHVAFLDSKRFELGASDDTALLGQDPVVTITIPADGRYYVRVRESAFGGNNASWYRLHLGTFPRPLAVFPPGGQPGESLKVKLIGMNQTQTVKLPKSAASRHPVFATNAQGVSPSPNWLWTSPNRSVTEKEPNNNLRKQATPGGKLPVAFNGVISRPNDFDHFSFEAIKGQTFHVRAYARQLGSPLDPVLTFHYPNGRYISGNDDSGGADSYVRFRAPKNGKYIVRIYDHLRRGGKQFVYRIEFYGGRPIVLLSLRKYGRNTQILQTVSVPAGNRYAALVRTTRVDYRGELIVRGKNLPKGVKIHWSKMQGSVNQTPVVFEAAANAPQSGTLSELIARPANPKLKLLSSFSQTAELVKGPPNQSIFHRTTVNRLAVAVTQAVPFRIELVQPKAPLVRNGSLALRVRAIRAKGYRGQIDVRMLWNPPGVSSARSVRIKPKQTEVRLPLTANGRARIGEWQIVVTGWARVGNGNVYVSTKLVTLKVAQPYLSIKMNRAGVVQGKVAQIVCQIKVARPFPGKATVQLLGIPPGTRALPPTQTLTKDTKQLIFKIQTNKKTRPGRYRNVFCRVTLPLNGEQVIHRVVGRTELRVHRPPPPKLARKRKPKPNPKKPTKKKARPLTRLEQLRQQHKEQQQQDAQPKEPKKK